MKRNTGSLDYSLYSGGNIGYKGGGEVDFFEDRLLAYLAFNTS